MNKQQYLENMNLIWDEIFKDGMGDVDKITFERDVKITEIYSSVTYIPASKDKEAEIIFNR